MSTRIVFNPEHAGQTTIGSRNRSRGFKLSQSLPRIGPIFTRSYWSYDPYYYSSPARPVYHVPSEPMSAQASLVTGLVLLGLIGAAVYFTPYDCNEKCTYNWEGVGVCHCIEYKYLFR